MLIGGIPSPIELARLVLGVVPGISTLLTASAPPGRLEIVKRSQLACGGTGPHSVISGWVHLDSGRMFWSLFEADEGARDNGLVIQFEGGPGGSAFDHPFIGAGPCQIKRDATVEEDDGEKFLEAAPYPWTKHANLLALDYPIGAGFSTFDEGQTPPNSSAMAAWDFDVFLQTFYREYPQYIPQKLIISSLSYGGTTVPHVAARILENNNNPANWNRIRKNVDHMLLGNPFSDVAAELRWQYETSCKDQPAVFPESTCEYMLGKIMPCLDVLSWVEANDTVENRNLATKTCVGPADLMWEKTLQNRFNRDEPHCYPANLCFWWQDPLTKFMNTDYAHDLLGSPKEWKWEFVGSAFLRFWKNSDNMQYAYKLYTDVLESGTKLLVYSGVQDTICGWRSSLSWMRRTPSSYLEEFRSHGDTFMPVPEGSILEGDVMNAGTPYTLLRIEKAGHIVQQDNPQLTQAIVEAAVRGENYNPLV